MGTIQLKAKWVARAVEATGDPLRTLLEQDTRAVIGLGAPCHRVFVVGASILAETTAVLCPACRIDSECQQA